MYSSISSGAVDLAKSYKWNILPVHGINQLGQCTCGKKHSKPNEIGKHPVISAWNTEATTDVEQIDKWWDENPDYNIGVFAKPSGFFVIDIDPRNGGDDSFLKLEERAAGNLPPTVEAITGEYFVKGRAVRGRHLIYKCHPNEKFIGNFNKEGLPGIDIKHNGYILAAPSRHFSGVTYEWKPGHAPWEMGVAEAPEDLLAALRSKSLNQGDSSVGTRYRSADLGGFAGLEIMGERVDIEKMFQEGIDEGSRATEVYRLTCALANRMGTDHLNATAIETMMIRLNHENIRPPMELEGSNGLLMHVRRGIEFVKNNPLGIEVLGSLAPNLTDTTDARIADWLKSELGQDYCWTRFHGWLAYSEGIWSSVSEEAIIEVIRLRFLKLARDVDGAKLGGLQDQVRRLQSHSRIKAAEKLARGPLERDPQVFDSEKDLFPARNGVIDLKTKELLPHSPTYLFSRKSPIDYKPGASHEDWDRALRCVSGDTGRFLRAFLGQALTGYPNGSDLSVVAQGVGSNGKSLLFGAVMNVFDSLGVVLSEKVLAGTGDEHTTELADLMGMRLTLLEEFPTNRKLNTNRLKMLVGTQKITARKMRQDNVTFEMIASLVITTNDRISLTSSGRSVWRRLVEVSFPYSYVHNPTAETDRPIEIGLRERVLSNESGQLEAVLSWLVGGAQEWYSQGRKLSRPGQNSKERSGSKLLDNPVGEFLADQLRVSANSVVLTSELYQLFLTESPSASEYSDFARFVMAAKESRFLEENKLTFAKVRLANKNVSSKKPENSQLKSQLSCLLGAAFK